MAKRQKTKREMVYYELQNKIIKGVIRPGSRLIISKLAKQFNVSDIPVREALHMLAHDGYVLFTPHSGVTVSSLSEEDISQIFEIRINLESLASRLAVNNLSNSHINSLCEMVEDSKKYFESKDFQGYWEFNRSFHECIYKYSNNPRLVKIISDLYDLSTRYPTYYTSVNEIKDSIHAHEEILESLNNRDENLVETLMKDHTVKSYHHIIQRVRETNEENFTQQ